MLYPSLPRKRRLPEAPATPIPYWDCAELLLRLRGEGCSLAQAAAAAGVTTGQAVQRLELMTLEEGLRRWLMQEGVPERTALILLTLPDAVTRRRVARRIVQERLCIRDAALVAHAALKRLPGDGEAQPRGRQVIRLMRDLRPYRNAIRDIAGQMAADGVRATYSERRQGGMLEVTVSYPVRRRRTERHHAM